MEKESWYAKNKSKEVYSLSLFYWTIFGLSKEIVRIDTIHTEICFKTWKCRREFFSPLSFHLNSRCLMIWANGRNLFPILERRPFLEAYQIPPNLQGSLGPSLQDGSTYNQLLLVFPSLNIYIYFMSTQLSTEPLPSSHNVFLSWFSVFNKA